jgi:tetratricopeptide (TPR) repeat protein
VHLQNTVLCAPEQRGGLLSAALAHARTAVALDDLDCVNHCVLGRVLVLQRRYEEGIAALEQSIALNASFAQAYFALGHAMIGDGRPRDALAYLTRATELSPRDPHLPIFYDLRAVAYLALGEEGTAAAFAHRATRLPNASYRAFSTLVAVLGRLGRLDEAAAAREELLRRRPEFSCAFAQDEFFYVRDDALVTRFVEGLRLAGVPERQSAPALGGAGLAGPARARPAGGRAEAGAA